MESAEAPEQVRNRPTILGVMSAGHGVAHLYDQGFPVLMPTIASYFGLSSFQVSVLLALRFTGFGVVNIGGGLVVDMLKRHWGGMLVGCMVSASLFFALVGSAPNYLVLLIIVPVVNIPGALWHLPSAASLSQIFPERRGFALAIHGFGANLGNLIGPLTAAFLLERLGSWRGVMFIYVGPALIMGVLVWMFLRDVGNIGDVESRSLRRQLRESAQILRSPVVLLLVGSAMLRGIGLDALFAWSPFYLEETLDKSHLDAGFHYALLTGMGIASTPALGYLSDRFGRKIVLVPGFAIAAGLSFITVGAGGGLWLTLVSGGHGPVQLRAPPDSAGGGAGRGGTRDRGDGGGSDLRSERDTGSGVAVPCVPGDRELRRIRVGVLLLGDTDAGGGGADNDRADASEGVKWKILRSLGSGNGNFQRTDRNWRRQP